MWKKSVLLTMYFDLILDALIRSVPIVLRNYSMPICSIKYIEMDF